jgi:hypothetical protein
MRAANDPVIANAPRRAIKLAGRTPIPNCVQLTALIGPIPQAKGRSGLIHLSV